jgi:hypothetical protein
MIEKYRAYAENLTTGQLQYAHKYDNDPQMNDPVYAQQRADEWANHLNKHKHIGTDDWQGKIEDEALNRPNH